MAMSKAIPRRVVAAVAKSSPPHDDVGCARILAAQTALDTSVCFCSNTERDAVLYMNPGLSASDPPPPIGTLCSHCSSLLGAWKDQLVTGMPSIPHLPAQTPAGRDAPGGITNELAFSPVCTVSQTIVMSAGGRADAAGAGAGAGAGDPSAAFDFMATLSKFIAWVCPQVVADSSSDPPALASILGSLACFRRLSSWSAIAPSSSSSSSSSGPAPRPPPGVTAADVASTQKFVLRLASLVTGRREYQTALRIVMAYGRLMGNSGGGHPVAVFNIAMAGLVCCSLSRNATLRLLQEDPLTSLLVCLDMSRHAAASPWLHLISGKGSGVVFDVRLLTSYARDLMPLSAVASAPGPSTPSLLTSATSMFMDATRTVSRSDDPLQALSPIDPATAIAVVSAHFSCEVVPWDSVESGAVEFPVPTKPKRRPKPKPRPTPKQAPTSALPTASLLAEDDDDDDDGFLVPLPPASTLAKDDGGLSAAPPVSLLADDDDDDDGV